MKQLTTVPAPSGMKQMSSGLLVPEQDQLISAAGGVPKMPFAANHVADFHAQQGPVYDSGTGKVSSWIDLINAYTVAQPTGGNQPVRTVNQQNNKPGIVFDGASSQFLHATSSPLAALFVGDDTPWTMYIVARLNSLGTLRYWYSFGRAASTSGFWGLNSSTGNIHSQSRNDDANASAGANASGTLSTVTYIVVATFTGSAITIRRNNANVLNAAASNIGVITPDRFTIGAFGRSTTVNFFDGPMFRLGWYNISMNTTDMDTIGTALNTEWAVF